MEKINYLNVGCGTKFHPAWTNIDMVAADPAAVQAVNLIKGIPFETGQFDLVYHSQVCRFWSIFRRTRRLYFWRNAREC